MKEKIKLGLVLVFIIFVLIGVIYEVFIASRLESKDVARIEKVYEFAYELVDLAEDTTGSLDLLMDYINGDKTISKDMAIQNVWDAIYFTETVETELYLAAEALEELAIELG